MITNPASELSDQELSLLLRQFCNDNPGVKESIWHLDFCGQEDTGSQGQEFVLFKVT